jgi:hypothetical protein
LNFSTTAVTVGKGLNSYYYDVYVYRTLNGANYTDPSALTVNLTSSDQTKLAVPATVTIPANSYYTYFQVSGVNLTSTAVMVDATATSYASPATKLSANVVTPQLQYTNLDGLRNTLSLRDDFYVQTYVPGAANPSSQGATSALTVGLSVTDTGTNFAPSATLSSSSIYGNDTVNYGPQRAVDGNLDTTSLTNYELHSWWQADLGQDRTFDRIVITSQSCCSTRNQYVVLVASSPFVAADFTGTNLPTTYSNGAQVVYQTAGATETARTFTISGPFTGRYVRVVYKAGSEYMYLSEVQIMQGNGGALGAGGIVSLYNAATGGSVITQATIPAGSASTGPLYVGQPTATGTYALTASVAGIAANDSFIQTVVPADLRLNFSTTAVTVGKGLNSYYYDVYVYRTLNGANYTDPSALTVNLACASAVICTVPTSVTLPANSYYAYFQVSGQGFGSTSVVASALGYTSNADLGVTIVSPELRFNSLVGSLAVGGANIFQVSSYVTGAPNPYNQNAISNAAVTLTSASPGVATVTSAVTIPANSTISGNATLTGVAAGSTSVTASGGLFTPAASGTITVGP